MTIEIKSLEDIDKMRLVGRLAAEQLEMLEEFVKPGVSTEKLNQICHEYTTEIQNAIPAPLNYRGFPKINLYIC